MSLTRRLGLPALTIMVATAIVAAAPATTPLPPLNAKVVEFANSQRGNKVGDGSCITLAIRALAHAGAKRYPLHRSDGDYEWGRRIERLEDSLPGDVLQFRDAEFKGKKRFPKGRWISWHQTYHHHTAIVSGVGEGGKVLTVLHQNVGPETADEAERKVVQEGTLRLDSLQKGGWVRAYRPVEPDTDTDTAN